jgi:hypothetical protein
MTLSEWLEAGNTLPDTLSVMVYGSDFKSTFTAHYFAHTINDSEAYPFLYRLAAVIARTVPYYRAKLDDLAKVNLDASEGEHREIRNFAAPNTIIDPLAPIGGYDDTVERTDSEYTRALARAELAKMENIVTAFLAEFACCFATVED